jgi:hypothetical protein
VTGLVVDRITKSVRAVLGSARASRAGFGALAETNFSADVPWDEIALFEAKVRDGEGAIASTRGACAPQRFFNGHESPDSLHYVRSGSFKHDGGIP